MAEIASWNGHSFVVSPTVIRGFTGLTITGSSETEDKTSDGDKYVSRKNGNPSQVSLVAELNALVGCDVRNEAMKFIDDAYAGKMGYFYMGGKKLIACQLMLTEASISETIIAPNGTWISCKVQLTMKQCSKYDGSSAGTSSSSGTGASGSSSGSQKASTKQTSFWTKAMNTVKEAFEENVETIKSNLSGGLSLLQKLTNTAKKTSATTKEKPVGEKIIPKSIVKAQQK